MKIEKILAIAGAFLIIVSFFLPWEKITMMDVTVKYSGFGIAKGSPGGNYNPNPLSQTSDKDFLNELWADALEGTGGESLANINNAINRLLAQPILYIFPVTALLIALLTVLVAEKLQTTFGFILIGVAVLLLIFIGVAWNKINNMHNIGDLASGFMGIFGLQEFMPKPSFGVGFYGTILGILVVLAAGILAWRAASQDKIAPAYAYSGSSGRSNPAYQPRDPYQGYQPNPQYQSQTDQYPSQNYQPGSESTWSQQAQLYQGQSAYRNDFGYADQTQTAQAYSDQMNYQSNRGYQDLSQQPPSSDQQYFPGGESQTYRQLPSSDPYSGGQSTQPFAGPMNTNPVMGWRAIKKPGDKPDTNP